MAAVKLGDGKNAYALPIGGKAANRVLQDHTHKSGSRLKSNELREINEELTAYPTRKSYSYRNPAVYWPLDKVSAGMVLIGPAMPEPTLIVG